MLNRPHRPFRATTSLAKSQAWISTLFLALQLNSLPLQAEIFAVPPGEALQQMQRPRIERLPLPEYLPPEAPQTPSLPAPPAPRKKAQILGPSGVFVRKFRITGNTVFSARELGEITAPYENRAISSEELQEVRHKLTLHYVSKGFINSGVVIPDQAIKDGIIELQVIEGKLAEIEVSGNTWLRSGYVSKRLALGAERPLNINALQERLLILRQDPLIERINAELGPGVAPGEGNLKVRVIEQRPYFLGLTFDNHRSPTIGAEQMGVTVGHRNLTGWGDSLWARYALTEGLDDVGASYSVPLGAYNTTVNLSYFRSSASIVEAPFDKLDINSLLETYSVTLSQPFHLNPYQTLVVALALERHHSETQMLGLPFSFSPGVQDGESNVTLLRLSHEWSTSSLTQVTSLRSIFSLGIDALSATVHNNSHLADGRYFAWVGQFQWARRLPYLDSQLHFRTDVQLASDSLLPLEKFSVGGSYSVRGYRESQLVRDNGWVSSLELRIPVFRLPLPGFTQRSDDGMVQLAPFVDFGWSWNANSSTPDPEIIYSAGLGVRWDPTRQMHGQLYWGKALREIGNPNNDLQDQGIHFLFSLQL